MPHAKCGWHLFYHINTILLSLIAFWANNRMHSPRKETPSHWTKCLCRIWHLYKCVCVDRLFVCVRAFDNQFSHFRIGHLHDDPYVLCVDVQMSQIGNRTVHVLKSLCQFNWNKSASHHVQYPSHFPFGKLAAVQQVNWNSCLSVVNLWFGSLFCNFGVQNCHLTFTLTMFDYELALQSDNNDVKFSTFHLICYGNIQSYVLN